MSKFEAGDKAVFNCDYAPYRVGDEVIVTDTSTNYTAYRVVKTGKTGSCYHWRLDKVVDAPMLPLTGGKEPQTGEQILDRAVGWLDENSDDDIEVSEVLDVARFLDYIDRQNAVDSTP